MIDPSLAELANDVLWELKLIHWLLIALVLLVGLLIYLFCALFRGLGTSVSLIEKQQNEKQFNQRLEDLLNEGRAKEVLFAATENLKARPKDPQLHWYLGQAYFQLLNYVEAKRAFSTLSDIAPNWAATAQPWLERVDEELRNASPKVVK